MPKHANIMDYRRQHAAALRVHRKAKRQFWRSYLETLTAFTKIRDVWDAVARMKGKYRSSSRPLRSNNQLIYSKWEKVETLARYFQSTMSNSTAPRPIQARLDQLERAKNPEDEVPDTDAKFTLNEMDNAMSHLVTGKSYGTDDIPNEFILHIPRMQLNVLLGIYNRSWTAGNCCLTGNSA